MKKAFISFCLIVFVAAPKAALVFAERLRDGPFYESVIMATDEGSQSDHIYTFADGQINPKEGETILMIDGAFSSKATVVMQNNRSLVPLRFVAEAFGAEVNWDESKQKVVVSDHMSVIEVTLNQTTAFINGKEILLDIAPVIINNTTYVSLKFISEKLNKDVGYLPAVQNGIGIAFNPVVWVSERCTAAEMEKAEGATLEFLKDRLNEGLAQLKPTLDNEASFIAEAIEQTRYVGQVGRYALYEGPYIILVDIDTNEIYFYKYGSSSGGIYKADMNDPKLFSSEQ